MDDQIKGQWGRDCKEDENDMQSTQLPSGDCDDGGDEERIHLQQLAIKGIGHILRGVQYDDGQTYRTDIRFGRSGPLERAIMLKTHSLSAPLAQQYPNSGNIQMYTNRQEGCCSRAESRHPEL